MRWNQGRATVDRLIADGELQPRTEAAGAVHADLSTVLNDSAQVASRV